jgi:CheY-like chemotaxis protein
MSNDIFRALVVDDEPGVRALTAAALRREGIECEQAADGDMALRLCQSADYDVVVTDLRMPHKHGHGLVVELLSNDDHPAIVVFTGLAEPRLAKDLMARGVDDIIFKPIDFTMFAAKVKAIVARRRANIPIKPEPSQAVNVSTVSKAHAGANDPTQPPHVDPEALRPKPADLPPSPPVVDNVVNLVRDGKCSAHQLAAVIKCDPVLSAEVIRLASIPLCNLSPENTADLAEAVARLGQIRVGELALELGRANGGVV